MNKTALDGIPAQKFQKCEMAFLSILSIVIHIYIYIYIYLYREIYMNRERKKKKGNEIILLDKS